MDIFPAIDLQQGRCVRLLRGDFAQETVYHDDPVAAAREWMDAGAPLLHVVDLDGTRQGHPAQLDLIQRIAAIAPIEVGGGLRTALDVERVLAAGARRAVLGTAALDRNLVQSLTQQYGERLVVALDTRAGYVTVQGWMQQSEWTMLDLAQALIEVGVRRFLHTDVERDGAMVHPNYASLHSLIALGVPVIASGGVASLQDIRRLRAAGAEAVIVGRALYEGAFPLQEAVAHAR